MQKHPDQHLVEQIERKKSQLRELGIIVDDTSFVPDQSLKKGKYKINVDDFIASNEYFSVFVTSDKVKPLLEDFAREERDAWAHALRVLRFLRKKGFDLEPELKSLKDIQDVIHYCLGTYQYVRDTEVEQSGDIKKFTVKSRYEPQEAA